MSYLHLRSGRARKPNALRILNQFLSDLEEHSGATVQVDTGESPGTGMGVSIAPQRCCVFSEMPTPDEVMEFVFTNIDYLEQDDLYLGGWRDADDGRWYLDITRVVLGPLAAASLARLHGQKAIYNFDSHNVIEVKDVYKSYR